MPTTRLKVGLFHLLPLCISKKEGSGMDKFVCLVCGYECDPATGDPEGIEPGTNFEDLPMTGFAVCRGRQRPVRSG